MAAQKRSSVPGCGNVFTAFFPRSCCFCCLTTVCRTGLSIILPLSSYIPVPACNYASSTETLFINFLVHAGKGIWTLAHPVQNYTSSFHESWKQRVIKQEGICSCVVYCGRHKWTLLLYSFWPRIGACLSQTYIWFMAKQTKHPSLMCVRPVQLETFPNIFVEAANYDP